MQVVLGIDAAWTSANPSGVAVAMKQSSRWHLKAVEASYENFFAQAENAFKADVRPKGSLPNVSKLLASAKSIAGSEVNLVAIDMPLSLDPITGSRESDRAVGRAYGSRNCSTYTPSVKRPGKISDDLRIDFNNAQYPLLTKSEIYSRGIIEVYPHPALVELASASYRLLYKASKTKTYWPEKDLDERKKLLHAQWSKIVKLLSKEIEGVEALLVVPSFQIPAWERKAFEDKLDAVICAWVGICMLEGQARPYGDEKSAIWIPLSKSHST
jgi:hypothetical protein